MGRYGLDAGSQVADFDFGYDRLGANSATTVGSYIIRLGDTLRGIARMVYGDADLWGEIAYANGLSGDMDLHPGQVLSIPPNPAGLHNNEDTLKPFETSLIKGNTTPNLASPGPACGGQGKFIAEIVAVVVAVMVAAATGDPNAAWYSGQNILAAAAASGSGALAGEVTAVAIGLQDDVNWKGVALATLGGAISGGAMPAGTNPGTVILHAALSNATTQGIGVLTGLQEKFDWRGVAAAAAGAAAGQLAGKAFANTDINRVAAAGLRGFASGLVAAAAHGGSISARQVAVDAFGTALGESLASNSTQGNGTPSSPSVQSGTGDHIIFGKPDATKFPELSRFEAGAAYGWYTPPVDRSGDVQLAAGAAFALNQGNDPDRFRPDNLARMRQMLDSVPSEEEQPLRIEINGVGRYMTSDEWNAWTVEGARQRGEDLSPTVANAERLGLKDLHQPTENELIGMQIAAASAGPDAAMLANDLPPSIRTNSFGWPGSVEGAIGQPIGIGGDFMREFKHGALQSIQLDTADAAQRGSSWGVYGNAVQGAFIENLLPGSPEEAAAAVGGGIALGKVAGLATGAAVRQFPILGLGLRDAWSQGTAALSGRQPGVMPLRDQMLAEANFSEFAVRTSEMPMVGNIGTAGVEGAAGAQVSSLLPSAAQAVIDAAKIKSYALNPDHPVGGNKARVFDSALGFNQSNADEFISQVQQGVMNNTATLGKLDNYGQRYTVIIPMTGPNGNTVPVLTGWILDPGSTIPRLTTTTYVK